MFLRYLRDLYSAGDEVLCSPDSSYFKPSIRCRQKEDDFSIFVLSSSHFLTSVSVEFLLSAVTLHSVGVKISAKLYHNVLLKVLYMGIANFNVLIGLFKSFS